MRNGDIFLSKLYNCTFFLLILLARNSESKLNYNLFCLCLSSLIPVPAFSISAIHFTFAFPVRLLKPCSK